MIAFFAPLLAAAALASPAPVTMTPIGAGKGPCGNTYAFGYVWVGASDSDALYRIDPRTNRPRGFAHVGRAPCGVTSGAGSLWVEDYENARIDRVNPRTLKVVARIPAGVHVWDVIFAAGSVWATNWIDGTVERIDPRTNKVVARIATGGNPANLAFAFGAVWVGSDSGDSFFRIDPATNQFTMVELPGQSAPSSITPDATGLWISNRDSGTVSHYEVGSATVLATIAVGRGPVVSAFASDGTLFVPNGDDNTISRIDPASNVVVDTITGFRSPLIVRSWLGDLWVGNNGGTTIVRLHIPQRERLAVRSLSR